MRIFALALLGCGLCWGQATECKPSIWNIPAAQYPCVYPDLRATFRVWAPNAQKVQVRVGGSQGAFDMVKGADGAWTVTTTPLVVGFHYYNVILDGSPVADPATHMFFASGWEQGAIEIPEPTNVDYYLAKDVPHGQVSERWYYSKTTGRWRRSFVYTPPNYDNGKTRYPVLYLVHGFGEDEYAWHRQGRAGFILDNLIAAGKAKPMLLVMDNLNAVRPGESDAAFAARGLLTTPPTAPAGGLPPAGGRGPEGQGGRAPAGRGGPAPAGRGSQPELNGLVFTENMVTDLIPMIEKTYRVLPGRENRAIAGLSQGARQAFQTGIPNLAKFAYIGGFSGGSGVTGGVYDAKAADLPAYKDAAAFNKQVKVLFLCVGSVEGSGQQQLHEMLDKAGINNVFFVSPGTAHEFLTWRRCLNDFAPRIFK
jgi:enterochelin esterase-like enzyme